MKMMMALVAAVAVTSPALAKTHKTPKAQAPYTCGLTFVAEGSAFQIGIGFLNLTGPGTVTCVDARGGETVLPVDVTVSNPPIFPVVAIAPRLVIQGVATGIGIHTAGPESIFGTYLAGTAQGAFGVGLGAVVALQGDDNALSFNLGLNGSAGLGVAAGFTTITIAPAQR